MYLVSKILLLWRRCLTELAQSCTLQLSLRTSLRKKKSLHKRSLHKDSFIFFLSPALSMSLHETSQTERTDFFFFFPLEKLGRFYVAVLLSVSFTMVLSVI